MATVSEAGGARLERSCGRTGGWMRTAADGRGLNRAEAWFAGHAFAPHRHDTYAIGLTLEGVQAFRYRGAAQRSMAGEAFVLHPDELHDGSAGTEAGFRYRILYLSPDLVSEALGRCPLPFVRDAVSRNRRIASAIAPALADIERPLEALERDQIVLDIAEALADAEGSTAQRRPAACWKAVAAARDFVNARIPEGVSSEDLEAAAGLSRYELARQFRACLGTSPYRYLLMRRLDHARGLIGQGAALAHAAVGSGFADQAHFTRRFRAAFGLSPGRWAAMVGRNAVQLT